MGHGVASVSYLSTGHRRLYPRRGIDVAHGLAYGGAMQILIAALILFIAVGMFDLLVP
jgi:hypothetical protein